MRKKVNKKLIVALLSFVLLFGGTFGSSLAWLLDTSDDVNNVFTTSDINIELTETTGNEYKMIPGHTIEKNPKVTVKADSEDCYLFIKVDENGGDITVGEGVDEVNYSFKDFIEYAIDPNNWEQLYDEHNNKVNGVYVYNTCHKSSDQDSDIKVLGYYNGEQIPQNFVPNKVLVKDTVTKEMMNAFDTDGDGKLDDNEKKNLPSLTFTAYASQYWESNGKPFDAIVAWNNVNND